MFVAIAVFAVWLGVVAQGYRLFGPGGALASGALFFIVIAAVLRLCQYWRTGSTWQRASPIIVGVVAILAMVFLTFEHISAGSHRSWQHFRRVEQLQYELNLNPAFKRIHLTYVEPRFRGIARWVVQGEVDSQNDLKMLKAKVGQLLPDAAWDVDVNAR
jgi:hypothetical protein